MISVADFISQPIHGNYFAPDVYVQGDFELGLLENRSGARLLALPQILIESIYATLAAETGQASGLVMYNCGSWWGKNFYRRFASEISNYYGKSLAEIEMIRFIQCLKQCWQTHGWGILDTDFSYYQQGFIVVKTVNSPFAEAAGSSTRPMCFIEAGILAAFFSQLSGKELECVQTSCESMQAESNHFVLGLSDRLKTASAWLEEGQDHQTIMERLCQQI